MPIVKIKKRTHPYVMIDSRVLNDASLSWRAKGLHAYLLSKPDNWKVIFTELVKHARDGSDAVRATLNELRDHGFAVLKSMRDDRGLWKGSEWTVFEWPEDFPEHGDAGLPNLGESPVSVNPQSGESPSLGKVRASGKTDPSNNEYSSNPSNNNKTSKRVLAPDGERELLGQIAEILGEKEMKKNGGMWRKRIRHGQAERLALRHTIEDFKLLTPDQRRLIRKRAAWFTDRYRRNLVKINATSYIAARAKHVA